MPLTPSIACPTCGAVAVNMTSFSDSREQFICLDCGAHSEGAALDPVEKANERAKFEAMNERLREYDRAIPGAAAAIESIALALAKADRDTPSSQPYIVCPKCGIVSHNPNDVRERYCGHCHAFHDDFSK